MCRPQQVPPPNRGVGHTSYMSRGQAGRVGMRAGRRRGQVTWEPLCGDPPRPQAREGHSPHGAQAAAVQLQLAELGQVLPCGPQAGGKALLPSLPCAPRGIGGPCLCAPWLSEPQRWRQAWSGAGPPGGVQRVCLSPPRPWRGGRKAPGLWELAWRRGSPRAGGPHSSGPAQAPQTTSPISLRHWYQSTGAPCPCATPNPWQRLLS